jgi:hypothetical protein
MKYSIFYINIIIKSHIKYYYKIGLKIICIGVLI